MNNVKTVEHNMITEEDVRLVISRYTQNKQKGTRLKKSACSITPLVHVGVDTSVRS
jgi:hypothetical protein